MSKVLLNITIKNSDDIINFESEGILDEENNILIYDQDKVKNTLYLNDDVLEREGIDSIIKLNFNEKNNDESNIFLKGTNITLNLEVSVLNVEKKAGSYRVYYIVENKERIEYEIKYKII